MALPKTWKIRPVGVISTSEGLRLVFVTAEVAAGPVRKLACPLTLDEAREIRAQLDRRIEEWNSVV